MKLLRQKVNPHSGIKYRLLFDSREWEWILCAREYTESKWVTMWRFMDLDKAELHFHTLTRINKGKLPKPFEMEKMK